MKKIKVKPIFGSHQIYQEMINFPPENVKYIGVKRDSSGKKDTIYYKKKKLREKLGLLLQKLKIPRMIFVRPGNYDLIHSSRGIVPLNNKPWVIDMEHVHSFFGLNPQLIKNKFWKKFIEKKLGSRNCKAILCHCEATRQAFFHYLDCSKFKDKIKVLYPVSHINFIKKKAHKKIRLLSVLSFFEAKGAIFVLEAFSTLERKYKNIELWLRADTPAGIRERFNSKNIKYIPYSKNILPREKLLENTYSQVDIFLYPSFCDSFGYSLMDAMVAKLPIISTNLFAIPEIVEHKENGLIVNIPGYKLNEGFVQEFFPSNFSHKERKEFLANLVSTLETLILDKRLREKMAQEGFKKVSRGKFSIDSRNKILKEIYKEALK